MTGSATFCCRGSWARRSSWSPPASASGSRRAGRTPWRRCAASGGTPYPIPAGASDHALGGLGFANWADEVHQQEQQLGVYFDTIIVCTVTGSTHAGMIAGFAGQDRPRRVLGIDASAKIAETRAQVEKIARNTAELIGLGRDLRDDEITVLEGWAGDAYGIPVASTLDAIRLTGRLEGIILDPVYEGKSMAALIDLIRAGDISKDSTVLYAHLGGQPALNAYSALFRTDLPITRARLNCVIGRQGPRSRPSILYRRHERIRRQDFGVAVDDGAG